MIDAIQQHNSEAKRRAVDAVFNKYGEVWLIALSQAPDVRLPEQVAAKHAPRIAIRLSYRLARPTRHITEPDGIEFDVSFSGVYTTCWFPWSAVLVVHGPRQADGSAEMFGWSPPTEPPPALTRVAKGAKLRIIQGGRA